MLCHKIVLRCLGFVVTVVLNQNWLPCRKRVVVEGCYSSYRYVTSEVMQGPMLGRLLFVINLNILDVNVYGFVSKTAHINILWSCEQRDIELQKWAEKWWHLN